MKNDFLCLDYEYLKYIESHLEITFENWLSKRGLNFDGVSHRLRDFLEDYLKEVNVVKKNLPLFYNQNQKHKRIKQRYTHAR